MGKLQHAMQEVSPAGLPLVLGGIPVHTEYRCLFFLRYEFFKIPQYRCHLNNVRNATLLEMGLFFYYCIVARTQLYVLLSVKVQKLKQ